MNEEGRTRCLSFESPQSASPFGKATRDDVERVIYVLRKRGRLLEASHDEEALNDALVMFRVADRMEEEWLR